MRENLTDKCKYCKLCSSLNMILKKVHCQDMGYIKVPEHCAAQELTTEGWNFYNNLSKYE